MLLLICRHFSKYLVTSIIKFFYISNKFTFFIDSDENNSLTSREIYDFYKYALAFIQIDKNVKYSFLSTDLAPFEKNSTFIITFHKKELKELFQVAFFKNFVDINDKASRFQSNAENRFRYDVQFS